MTKSEISCLSKYIDGCVELLSTKKEIYVLKRKIDKIIEKLNVGYDRLTRAGISEDILWQASSEYEDFRKQAIRELNKILRNASKKKCNKQYLIPLK